jgi:integrase
LKDKELKPDKKNFEYRGLISRWTDLQVIRETWKRELLKGERKNDNEYLEELEEKWKIKLFGEHPIPIIESDADEPTQPYLVKPKSIEVKYNKVKSPSSPFFCDMFPKHIERMRENKRREQTINETIETYKDVIELLGNKPIGEYSIIDGRDFRTSLLKIPKNRKRVKRYRDKTLKEVLEMDIPQSDKMSFHNVTKLISRMSSLWNFFVDEYPEYVTENVFKSKSIRVNPQKMKDRREEFSEDDLHLIFNPKTYLPAIFNNPTGRTTTIQYPYYFIPIFSALSGCRLEEICMMRTKDIIKINGVWVYRIREEGEYGEEETTVKNPYSERDIPLHPVLVDTLGFVRYVKHIKKLGHDRVFHELTKHNNKYQKSVSKFFNEKYLKQLGLKVDGRSVSFHSFRHSVETHLTNQNINPRFIDYLQGHSSKDTGANTYMKGIKPEVLLKECVEKFDWGIDWKKLKVDWTKSIR